MNLQQSELRICHKLTHTHLDVKKAGRQKVKYATQLFSHSVSAAIKRGISLGKMHTPHAFETSEFIKLVNDWFDVFNCSSAYGDFRERIHAFDESNEVQLSILNRMTECMTALRVPKRRTMLPFQRGILVNNSALVQLCKSLKETYGNQYILTRRLQQDDLERFFGTIRSKGGLHDHPTSLEFMYRLRMSILGDVIDS